MRDGQNSGGGGGGRTKQVDQHACEYRKAGTHTHQAGDAHGHGPSPITFYERALLSAWQKQGYDWLMLRGKAGLVL
jgi:hypothetical protein